MTKVRLQGLPMEALQELCSKENLEIEPEDSKEVVVELLWDLYEEERRDWESLNNLIVKMEEKKFSLAEEPINYQVPDHNEIPPKYDSDYLVMMLRDPQWAFCYWEIRHSEWDAMKLSHGFHGLLLKVFQSSVPDRSQHEMIFTIPVQNPVSSRYINLPTQNKYYWVELLASLEKETKVLCGSRVVFSPQEMISFESYPNESENRKKILDFSGFKLCEPFRDQFAQSSQTQRRKIPQRIGDLDESMFAEELGL